MRQTLRNILLAAAFSLLISPAVQAADDAAPPVGGDKPKADQPRGDRAGGRGRFAGRFGQGGDRVGGGRFGQRGGRDPVEAIKAALAQLDLTAEQKTQTDSVLTKFADDRKAAVEKNRAQREDLAKQLQAAQDAKDDAKTKDIREQISKLGGNPGDLAKQLRDQVKAVLTAEQGAKFEQLMVANTGPARPIDQLVTANAEALALTADQKTKIEALVKDYDAAIKALKRDERATKGRELSLKLNTDVRAVLTADQLAKLDKLAAERPTFDASSMVARRLKDLNLTEDQTKKVADLTKAFQDASKATEGQARRDLVRKYMDDVRAVLTADQQTKWDAARPFGGRARGGDAAGGRPRRGNRGGNRGGDNPAPAKPDGAGATGGTRT